MLQDVLVHIHNWFEVGRRRDTFSVGAGGVSPDPSLQEGQYYRIRGSVFNDGLHRWPDHSDLREETFTGEVWPLAVPQAVQDLAGEIGAWVEAQPDTPYTSESFGGYSYTRPTGTDGVAVTWQAAFRDRLNPWRKIS